MAIPLPPCPDLRPSIEKISQNIRHGSEASRVKLLRALREELMAAQAYLQLIERRRLQTKIAREARAKKRKEKG